MKKIICWSFLFCILLYACGNGRGGSSSSGYVAGYGYAAEEIYAAADEDVILQEEAMITTEQPKDVQYAPPRSNRTHSDEEAIHSFQTALAEKKIIKDGDLTIQTNDIEVAKKRIDKLVESVNGYYERENLHKYDYRVSYNLSIRVPANNFEKLLSSVETGNDEVENKNIRTRDVTEEYFDVSTRLATKRDYLKQYTVLLSRTNSVKDILEIKENIRNLQEEIESAEGRLRYLNDQVTFSTLTVELYQKIDYVYKPKPKDSFFERVKSGVSTGWDMIVNFVLFLISIWSVLLVLILAFFFIRRKIKKRKQRKNS